MGIVESCFTFIHLSIWYQNKFICKSSCNKRYKNALYICNAFPQYVLKIDICYYFVDGESKRKENERTRSKSVNRSGLRPG